MAIPKINSSDPKEHAQNVEKYISELKHHLQDDIKIISEPKAKALFETAADILDGLEKAFSDYQSENFGGWVNDPDRPTIQ